MGIPPYNPRCLHGPFLKRELVKIRRFWNVTLIAAPDRIWVKERWLKPDSGSACTSFKWYRLIRGLCWLPTWMWLRTALCGIPEGVFGGIIGVSFCRQQGHVEICGYLNLHIWQHMFVFLKAALRLKYWWGNKSKVAKIFHMISYKATHFHSYTRSYYTQGNKWPQKSRKPLGKLLQWQTKHFRC